MNDDDFSIPTGKALFLDRLQKPTPGERLALRNNRSFRYLAAEIKARHHDSTEPAVRENLRIVMGLMDVAATPPKVVKIEPENEDENGDESGYDLNEP